MNGGVGGAWWHSLVSYTSHSSNRYRPVFEESHQDEGTRMPYEGQTRELGVWE